VALVLFLEEEDLEGGLDWGLEDQAEGMESFPKSLLTSRLIVLMKAFASNLVSLDFKVDYRS
jgi:hypothetical protein